MKNFHSKDSLIQGIETIISSDDKRRNLSETDLQILISCKEVLKERNELTAQTLIEVVIQLMRFFEVATIFNS